MFRKVVRAAMDYLYFPEDFREMIPGFIWFGVVLIASAAAVYLFKWLSERELRKSDDKKNDQ